MASLTPGKNGNRRIQFKGPDGKRKTLYLGKLPKRDCEVVKSHVEYLLIATTSGRSISPETANWLTRISDDLHKRLVGVGLVEPRDATTVVGLIECFLAANSQVKPATLVVWKNVENDLRQHFGEEHPIRNIERSHAEAFRQGLIKRDLAATTIHKRLQFARRFFGYALDQGWTEENPFKGVKHKSGSTTSRSRKPISLSRQPRIGFGERL